MIDFHPLRPILVLLLSLLWATMGSATALAERGDFDLSTVALVTPMPVEPATVPSVARLRKS